MHLRRSVQLTIVLVALIMLGGCTQEEASTKQFGGEVFLSQKVTEKDVTVYDYTNNPIDVRFGLNAEQSADFYRALGGDESFIHKKGREIVVYITESTAHSIASDAVMRDISSDLLPKIPPTRKVIYSVGLVELYHI